MATVVFSLFWKFVGDGIYKFSCVYALARVYAHLHPIDAHMDTHNQLHSRTPNSPTGLTTATERTHWTAQPGEVQR